MSGSDPIARGKRVLEIEAEAVRALVDRIGEGFARAVEIMLAIDGKIVVTGLGKSGLIARKIAATLASTGTPAIFLHAAEAGHGDLGIVHRSDAVLALSNSGESREVLRLLPVFKRLALPIVAITGAPGSTLGRAADAVLDVGVGEEACPLALAPTSSTTAALAMGDALAIVLMERRGFREEDFASIHPDGALGRRLLRVAELMHVGDRMPLVADTDPLGRAIAEMSAKRLGHTGVVDAAGRLVGIVTDGDLRRLLQAGRADRLETPVRELMTRDPKTVGERSLGAEAVATMERYSVTALFIVDEDGRPRGVLHLHDLLRAGVV
jgi:arabinose-5-phosphate isomerase